MRWRGRMRVIRRGILRGSEAGVGEGAGCAVRDLSFGYYEEHILDDPEVVTYFEQSTPIAELEKAKIGSRPSRRNASTKLADLRAIPWVFGWTQSRLLMPAWFGVGFALEEYLTRARRAGIIADDGEGVSAVHRPVAQCGDGAGQGGSGYGASLLVAGGGCCSCESGSTICSMRSFIARCAALLAVLRQKELLEKNQVLAHSIKLRNPYVDPMHLIQVDMLRRKRAGEDTPEMNRAIAATISGISAGLRNTG